MRSECLVGYIVYNQWKWHWR